MSTVGRAAPSTDSAVSVSQLGDGSQGLQKQDQGDQKGCIPALAWRTALEFPSCSREGGLKIACPRRVHGSLHKGVALRSRVCTPLREGCWLRALMLETVTEEW